MQEQACALAYYSALSPFINPKPVISSLEPFSIIMDLKCINKNKACNSPFILKNK
jgi:hypothetical protein